MLFPGLRLGCIVAPPALVDPIVRAKAALDRHNVIVPQMVLADFMGEGHFARHIKRTREAYAERRCALLDGIAARLGDELRCGPSDAGLDLCVFFRRAPDQDQVAHIALAQGVEVRPLSYYASRVATPDCDTAAGLLLGFSSITMTKIAHGLQVLEQVLRAARKLC